MAARLAALERGSAEYSLGWGGDGREEIGRLRGGIGDVAVSGSSGGGGGGAERRVQRGGADLWGKGGDERTALLDELVDRVQVGLLVVA